MRRVVYVAAATVLFIAFAGQLLLHATSASTTIEEPTNLLSGLRHLTCGDFSNEHPPLTKLVAALPLLAMDLKYPIEPCGSESSALAAGAQFVLANGLDRVILPVRIASMAFSLLLAALVFAAARMMFGPAEGLLALAVVAFEPTLIAHGSILMNDMSLTVMLFATLFALHCYRERPTIGRLLLVGLATGLTLAAKHSGLIVLPLVALFLWPRIKAGAAVAAIAACVLVAAYGGQWNAYLDGYRFVVSHGDRVMYLFDRAYPTGRWFYFPIVFSIKASLALLALLPFALRSKRWILLVPAALFLAASMSVGLNIGVRHILPIWPFLIVAGAGGVWAVARQRTSTRIILAALLLFHALSGWSAAPHSIAFGNELWGGTGATHRLVKDSNVEMGQNMKIVRAWLASEGITDCWLAAYGPGSINEVQQPCRLLPAFAWSVGHVVNAVPPVIEGTVLLNATTLPPRGGPEYGPIIATKPIAVLGGSILVYRGTFRVPLLAAVSHATRAKQFLELRRPEEALAEATIAMQLAPGDRRVQGAMAAARAAQ